MDLTGDTGAGAGAFAGGGTGAGALGGGGGGGGSGGGGGGGDRGVIGIGSLNSGSSSQSIQGNSCIDHEFNI